MKNILLILIAVLFISSSGISQQNNFEGEVHFKIEYANTTNISQYYIDTFPKSIHFYFRNKLICSQGPTSLDNGYLIKIINLEKKQGYLGWKFKKGSAYKKIESTEIEEDYEALPKPVNIEYLNETKSFGGFVGKKALIFLDNSSAPITVYYSEEIPKEGFPIYQGLKGFPLYYEGKLNGVPFKAYATKVLPKPQPDERFKMPSEYKLLNKEEFKAFIIGS